MKWNWWRRYVLNIATLVAIFVTILVLYFIFTVKRRRYSFRVPDGSGFDNSLNVSERKLKHKRKRALNKHEEECRRIFQDLFGVQFKTVRPKWLKNPVTKKNLELDGYNPSIETPLGQGLAFEYDGEQHSKYNPHFHQNGPNEFEYQVIKDSWKDQKCKERGVLLVRIPHFVAFQDLERYIKMILKREGITPSRTSHGLYARAVSPSQVYKNFTRGASIYG